MEKVVTFGEIMLRLAPPGFLRIVQARSFDAIYAGAEANVAITLANLGVSADYVTRLPNNDVGDACLNYLRQFGVGTEKIIRGGDRLGIYFLEIGAAQRGNKVIYDRANSAFATINPKDFNWNKILSDACWFHWTGITPAVSEGAADTCLEAVKKAKEMGLTVSCDINYRSMLWKWGKSAKEVMSQLAKFVDILIGNEEDAEKVFGVKAPEVDVARGEIKATSYENVAKQLMKMFPNLKLVNFALRGSISASHNTWSGVSYDGKKLYLAPVYDITHIVDRVGAGDSFSGGFIYGMLTYKNDLQKALNFAVAISCLKHSIYGDSCIVKLDEIEKLMKGITSGRITR
ncbi:sugar kinase [Candidatus Bathyarchaeota archaeon]|nr:sugar kinase [Candidatus Bathyarchaeota archaeon]